jgi:hypothetical protein
VGSESAILTQKAAQEKRRRAPVRKWWARPRLQVSLLEESEANGRGDVVSPGHLG